MLCLSGFESYSRWEPLNLQHLITCFRNYDILAKTRSKMKTAITFSCPNNAVSSVRAT